MSSNSNNNSKQATIKQLAGMLFAKYCVYATHGNRKQQSRPRSLGRPEHLQTNLATIWQLPLSCCTSACPSLQHNNSTTVAQDIHLLQWQNKGQQLGNNMRVRKQDSERERTREKAQQRGEKMNNFCVYALCGHNL